jgi:hypothetical protein
LVKAEIEPTDEAIKSSFRKICAKGIGPMAETSFRLAQLIRED